MLSRIAIVLVITIGVARADQRDDARTEFTAGQAADKDHDWQNAIEHYLRAYDLAPHPFALYNIASDYEQLGQLREAARFYQRYLEVAKDDADRDRVRKLVDDLRKRPSRIAVRSTPPSARVVIDGKQAGVTPFIGVVRGGEHHITVQSDADHQDRVATMEYGEPTELEVTLRGVSAPATGGGVGTLYVMGGPIGAKVTVDGSPAGVIPTTVTVPAGPHHVTVAAAGYATLDVDTTVTPGMPTPVFARLDDSGSGGSSFATAMRAHYYIAVSGGVDSGDGSADASLEIGIRNQRGEVLAQAGKFSDAFVANLNFRVMWFASRLSPYIGFGYSFARLGTGEESALGGNLEGGLRYDVRRGDQMSLSLRVGIQLIGFLSDKTGKGIGFAPLGATLEWAFAGGSK